MRELGWSLALAAGLTLGGCGTAAADSPSIFALNASTVGVFGRTDLGLAMLEARAAVSPHLHFIAAPAVLVVDGGSTEQQLRTGATLLLDLGSFRIEDRNLWVFSDAGTTRYRNRLRLTKSTSISGQAVRFQVFDELYHDEGGRGWFRNLFAAGAGVDFGRTVSVDAYWMLQDDEGRPASSSVLVMVTAHLF